MHRLPCALQGEAALESLLVAIKDNVDPLDAAPGKRGAEDTPTGAAVLPCAYHVRQRLHVEGS